MRNGSNPPGGKALHWFPGDGMVHGVRLERGKASWYRNRYVATPIHAAGKDALTFGGNIGNTMTAHPKVDPVTGRMHFFGYEIVSPTITYYVADPKGKIDVVSPITLDNASTHREGDDIVLRVQKLPEAFGRKGDLVPSHLTEWRIGTAGDQLTLSSAASSQYPWRPWP